MTPSELFMGRIDLSDAQTREEAQIQLEGDQGLSLLPESARRDIIATIVDKVYGYKPALRVVLKTAAPESLELDIPAANLIENYADELEDIARQLKALAAETREISKEMAPHMSLPGNLRAASGFIAMDWAGRYGPTLSALHTGLTKRLLGIMQAL